MKAMKLLGINSNEIPEPRRDTKVEDERLSKPIVFPSDYPFAVGDSDSTILYFSSR
jgi:hypothetical protein